MRTSARQAIVAYEERLERTRHELAVVSATLTIMQRDGGLIDDSRPAHVRNLFKRSKVLALCKAALADVPDGLSTRAHETACLAYDGRPSVARHSAGIRRTARGVR